jgi:hypothetical protein
MTSCKVKLKDLQLIAGERFNPSLRGYHKLAASSNRKSRGYLQFESIRNQHHFCIKPGEFPIAEISLIQSDFKRTETFFVDITTGKVEDFTSQSGIRIHTEIESDYACRVSVTHRMLTHFVHISPSYGNGRYNQKIHHGIYIRIPEIFYDEIFESEYRKTTALSHIAKVTQGQFLF